MYNPNIEAGLAVANKKEQNTFGNDFTLPSQIAGLCESRLGSFIWESQKAGHRERMRECSVTISEELEE